MAWPLRNDSDCGSRASVSAIALAAAAACCGGSLERLCSMSGLDRPVRNNHFWRILLKKSKIAGLRKSRECGMLVISAAARLCRTNTGVGGRFCVNRCGPSHRSACDARAVLRIFSHQPKRTFSTQSAQSGRGNFAHGPKETDLVGGRCKSRPRAIAENNVVAISDAAGTTKARRIRGMPGYPFVRVTANRNHAGWYRPFSFRCRKLND
jgi:hypothetical protein